MAQREKLLKIISETIDTSDQKTENIFGSTKSLKVDGLLTKKVGIEILKWKSPRPLRHYESNSKNEYETISKIAFQQKDEKLKIHILTALNGVSIPAASAILMFYDQKKYPVIDIRVWRQLYKFGLVLENESGQGFTLNQWETYLKVIRQISKELSITPRQVEKRLFDYDKKNQKGNLYK
jgi:hypothetical protein